MSLSWVILSGAMISKSYLQSKTIKVKPFAFVKYKYSFETYINDRFDLRK